MPCYHPLPGWRSATLSDTGKRPVTFRMNEGDGTRMEIPCGQCMGCRVEKGRQWALRLTHESRFHRNSAFITLTYDDAHLPPGGSLRPEDWVLFMKRLRFHHQDELRFFQCGEYGETTQRPHHHALLFGWWPDDGVRLNRYSTGTPLWDSKQLRNLWGHGNISVGLVTPETTNYVAGYVTKKLTGPAATEAYGDRVPPYATMSRRPGIGRLAIETWGPVWYRDDAITLPGGTQVRPPRYYDQVMGRLDSDALAHVQMLRDQEKGPWWKKRTEAPVKEANAKSRRSTFRKREPQ
ncbi:MAG: replication initiator protein [Microviridae sp.]|nr:MAG: replication initiator protein [Microviridae sp.]